MPRPRGSGSSRSCPETHPQNVESTRRRSSLGQERPSGRRRQPRRAAMRYVLMTWNGPEHVEAWDRQTADEKRREIGEVQAWFGEHGAAGRIAGGEELGWPHEARTVRKKGTTDGPFIETKDSSAASSSSTSPTTRPPSRWPARGPGSSTTRTRSSSTRWARRRRMPRRRRHARQRAPELASLRAGIRPRRGVESGCRRGREADGRCP